MNPELVENLILGLAIWAIVISVVLISLAMKVRDLRDKLASLSTDFRYMQNAVIRELGRDKSGPENSNEPEHIEYVTTDGQRHIVTI